MRFCLCSVPLMLSQGDGLGERCIKCGHPVKYPVPMRRLIRDRGVARVVTVNPRRS